MSTKINLSDSSVTGMEWIYNRTFVLHPVVYFCHRDLDILFPYFISSSKRVRCLSLCRLHLDGSRMFYFHLLMVLLFAFALQVACLLAVYNLFLPGLIQIHVFPAAFLRHLMFAVVTICISLLVIKIIFFKLHVRSDQLGHKMINQSFNTRRTPRELPQHAT